MKCQLEQFEYVHNLIEKVSSTSKENDVQDALAKFLPILWEIAKFDHGAMVSLLASPLLNKYFTVDSPEVQSAFFDHHQGNIGIGNE